MAVNLYIDCELVAKKKMSVKKLYLLFPKARGKADDHVFKLARGSGARAWKVIKIIIIRNKIIRMVFINML